VIARESSPKIAAELATLLKMSNQAGDALEVLQKTIVCAPPEGNA
jgi:hypothetical protein